PGGGAGGAAADPGLGGGGLRRAAAAVEVEPDHQLGAGGLAAGHLGFAEPDVVGGVVGAGDALAGVPGGDRVADAGHLDRDVGVRGADVPDAAAHDVGEGDHVPGRVIARPLGDGEVRPAAAVAQALPPLAAPVGVP